MRGNAGQLEEPRNGVASRPLTHVQARRGSDASESSCCKKTASDPKELGPENVRTPGYSPRVPQPTIWDVLFCWKVPGSKIQMIIVISPHFAAITH